MTAQTWRFTPLDSCFFRESRPMDTIGGSELTSSFPPPIRTLLGAIRTAIGEYNGVDWDNYLKGDQYALLREQLGTNNNLAEIEINGPWLVQKNDGQWQRLYPVPLNQIGSIEKGKLKIFALQPGAFYHCDLGENVRMAMPPEGLKKGTSLAEYWITGETLELLLSTSGNTIPQYKLIPATDLFTEEPRLGIARDNQLRTVEEGQLYQTRHIRPKPGVAIEVDLQGVTENQHFKLPQEGIIRLGAEARGAAFKVWPSRQAALTLTVPHPPYHKEAKGIMLTLLSPTAVQPAADGGYAPLPGFSRQDVGGRIIWKGTINGDSYTLHCAITGKVLREGGWDMQVHQPRTVQSYIPSGSVFYCTPDEITLAAALEKLHLAQLEQPEPIDQQLGRGRIIASLWIDRENNS